MRVESGLYAPALSAPPPCLRRYYKLLRRAAVLVMIIFRAVHMFRWKIDHMAILHAIDARYSELDFHFEKDELSHLKDWWRSSRLIRRSFDDDDERHLRGKLGKDRRYEPDSKGN